jgi:hypothetical protein
VQNFTVSVPLAWLAVFAGRAAAAPAGGGAPCWPWHSLLAVAARNYLVYLTSYMTY